MNGFVLSPAAQADISTIWDYTAERWGEVQAGRYVLAIRDACRQLAAGTLASRSADEIRAGYRRAAVGSHVLFFRLLSDETISIVRILHQPFERGLWAREERENRWEIIVFSSTGPSLSAIGLSKATERVVTLRVNG